MVKNPGSHHLSARTMRLARAVRLMFLSAVLLASGVLFWTYTTTASLLLVNYFGYDDRNKLFRFERLVNSERSVLADVHWEAHGNGLECSAVTSTLFERYVEDRQGRPMLGADGPTIKTKVQFPPQVTLLPCLSDPNRTVVVWIYARVGPIRLRPLILYLPPREGRG